MIKTEQIGSWSEKVNFIDKNDVFVGYDMSQDCCEDAGYVFLTEPEMYGNFDTQIEEDTLDLEGYIFDIDYFEDYGDLDLEGSKERWNSLDAGGQVFFKLISEGKPDIYLSIYNSHNGYYGHGFDTNINGTTGYTL